MKRLKTLTPAALALALLLSLLPAGLLAAQPSEVVIDPSLAYLDLNADGVISDIDISEVAATWESRRISGNVCAGPAPADVNGDGCVDIADVQTVASKVGIAVIEPAARAEQQRAMVAGDPTFVVTTTSDTPDAANPGDGVCQITAGGCSLRAAIDEANRMAGANTINFNIPGNGPHIINVTDQDGSDRAFTISDGSGPTIINGYSQPGSSPNTSPTISNAIIKIHIKGPRVASPGVSNYTTIDGIRVFSAGNEFRGLAFTHLRRSIWFSGSSAHDNVVAGSFVGTDPAGQPWYPAIAGIEGRSNDGGAYGVWIADGAHHNRVGGVVPADRTVISGNANDGGGGTGEGTDYNQFIGLIIGLSPDGTRRVQNGSDGLDLNYGMSYTQIGGTAPGERNVISGNPGDGVELSHTPGTEFNVIAGNYFGTAPDGNTVVNTVHFNSGYSVTLEDRVSNNIIGPGNVMVNSWNGGVNLYGHGGHDNHIFGNRIGITLNGTANTLTANRGEGIRIRFGGSENTIGPDNIITNNTDGGVVIFDDASRFNTITENSIYGNGAIGIDLGGDKETGGDGVTPNDGTWGGGPNQLIDYPVITSATTTSVSGTALPGYRVEVFIADRAAGQHGEGRTFVGAGVANGSGQFTVPVSGVAAGNVVTSTSTDSAGNTSEFGVNVAVTGGITNTPPVVSIDAPSNGATVSSTVPIVVDASDNEDGAGTLDVDIRIDGGGWQPTSWNAGSGRYQFTWDTSSVANGNHTVEARATDSNDAAATAGPITIAVNNITGPTFTLPTVIQAEDYDAYSDATPGNTGGRYRNDDVDIQTCSDPTNPSGQTCYNVGWIASGEWLSWDIRVPTAGNYSFALRVATPSSNRSVQLQLDGANLGAAITVPDTDGYQTWTTVTVVRSLPGGDHQLRLVFNTSNVNVNYMDITAAGPTNTPPAISMTTPADGATVSGTTTIGVTATDEEDATGTLNVEVSIDGAAWQPATWNAGSGRYEATWDTTSAANGSHTIAAQATDSGGRTGTAIAASVNVYNTTGVVLPATIQAEDYIGYFDSGSGNVGGAYRSDDVDIAPCSDGTPCYYVGWTTTGEWLSYAVQTTSTRTWTIQVRYASPYDGRRLRIEVDRAIVAQIRLPASGGWEAWQTATIGTVTLAPGQHTVRVLIDRDGLNINWLMFSQ